MGGVVFGGLGSRSCCVVSVITYYVNMVPVNFFL